MPDENNHINHGERISKLETGLQQMAGSIDTLAKTQTKMWDSINTVNQNVESVVTANKATRGMFSIPMTVMVLSLLGAFAGFMITVEIGPLQSGIAGLQLQINDRFTNIRSDTGEKFNQIKTDLDEFKKTGAPVLASQIGILTRRQDDNERLTLRLDEDARQRMKDERDEARRQRDAAQSNLEALKQRKSP